MNALHPYLAYTETDEYQFVVNSIPHKATAYTYIRDEPKIGRNDPCKCGSGIKYKKCCKALEDEE